jgi:hypothetical protein
MWYLGHSTWTYLPNSASSTKPSGVIFFYNHPDQIIIQLHIFSMGTGLIMLMYKDIKKTYLHRSWNASSCGILMHNCSSNFIYCRILLDTPHCGRMLNHTILPVLSPM